MQNIAGWQRLRKPEIGRFLSRVSASEDGFSGNQKTFAVLRRRSFSWPWLARVVVRLTPTDDTVAGWAGPVAAWWAATLDDLGMPRTAGRVRRKNGACGAAMP